MKTYLVGGAVRDRLLQQPVTERDWVVVGASVQTMLDKGFKPVGKAFPVFLHPVTHEEYALARTERKTAPGYTGFAVHAQADVTLEQDLQRRDLTINALAEDEHGQLIDPYGGLEDLRRKILRHVSPAFVEDPLRVLRVGRFAARYAHLGFTIADETLQLMREMVAHGEVHHLIAERVWLETVKALKETSPHVYFQVLRECGALAVIFPELERLFGVPQPPQHHPEIDTGVHSLLSLAQAARMTSDPMIRFAVVMHDLGKGVTDPARWPSHHGHEQLGLPVLDALCARLRVPNAYKKLARLVMADHTHCHRVWTLRATTLVDLLTRLGAYHETATLEQWLIACEADARGRTGFEARHYPQPAFIRAAWQVSSAIQARHIAANVSGQNFGLALRTQRAEAIQQLKHDSPWSSYFSQPRREEH